MDIRALHLLKVASVLLAVNVFLFIYPPVIESIVPNYFIHMELWIPFGIALHAGLFWLAYKRWPRQAAPPKGSTQS